MGEVLVLPQLTSAVTAENPYGGHPVCRSCMRQDKASVAGALATASMSVVGWGALGLKCPCILIRDEKSASITQIFVTLWRPRLESRSYASIVARPVACAALMRDCIIHLAPNLPCALFLTVFVTANSGSASR